MRRSVLCLLLSATFAAPVFASGQLDPRFDGDGVLVVNTTAGNNRVDGLRAGLIDHAGRHVGVGYAASGAVGVASSGSVVRFSATGVLDPSFGSGGIVLIPTRDAHPDLEWVAVAEQADDKLLVAGHTRQFGFNNPGRGYVCRLLTNGAMDPAFGDAGCIVVPFWFDSSTDVVHAMALQSDGRIVVLGETNFDNVDPLDYVVARLNNDGSLDTCFGDVTCQGGGRVIEPEPPAELPNFTPAALALAPDGRILIAGRAVAMNSDMAAVRLLPTGAVDQGFGNGGHRRIDFDQGGLDVDGADAVAVTDTGLVLVAGYASSDQSRLAAVARLTASGNLDPTFGSLGRKTLFFNDVAEYQSATALRLQDDGKLLVVGIALSLDDPYSPDCGIARLLTNGQLDPVFGIDGKLNIDAGLGVAARGVDECVAVDADGGAIALFGFRTPSDANVRDSLLLRLDQDGLFRDGYESPSP